MRTATWTTAIAVAAWAGAASAQGFRGAEVDLSRTAYTDGSEVGQTTLQGSVEFGFGPRFGMALDVGGASVQPGDGEAGTATLHFVFDVSPSASVGAFVASDEIEGLTNDAYGVEAGMGLGRGEFEVFAGVGTLEEVVDFSTVGLDGNYHLGERFALTTSLAYLSTEADVDGSRLGIGAETTLGTASTLYLEVGQDSVEGQSATYVGLGARFSFGPRRGTTFDPRGLVEVFGGL